MYRALLGVPRWRGLVVVLLLAATLGSGRAWAVECWRGWGYRVDPGTRTYVSDEMLLVTRGPVDWRVGVPVRLFFLDRSTGRIDASQPALEAVLATARTYYRGRSNYVDGRGAIAGSDEELVFGFNHVAEPSSSLPALQDYNRWACGLSKSK